jgi:hypothetical protein
MPLTDRISDRVRRDFRPADRGQAVYVLTSLRLPLYHPPEGDERVHAALLAVARGDLSRLLDAAALAELDWRDVLVAGGVAGEDWPIRVDAFLGDD